MGKCLGGIDHTDQLRMTYGVDSQKKWWHTLLEYDWNTIYERLYNI